MHTSTNKKKKKKIKWEKVQLDLKPGNQPIIYLEHTS